MYQYATVKDIGDIDKLATVVKTDLVGAINSILGNVPDNYQDIIDDLKTQLEEIASSGMNNQQIADMEQAITTVQGQISTELNNKLTAMNEAFDVKFSGITTKYDADVIALNNEMTGVKENLGATEADLTAVEGRLSTAELNVTDVTQTVDTVKGELLTKVETTDFNLLEATVTQQGTSIGQNAEAIALKASQESLDLTTGRITDAEASIVVNANAIKSTVKKSELKGELEGLDIYAPNIMNNTMDWYEWDATIPAKAYKLIETYQHTIIQEQLGFGGYFEDIVTGLVIGETYTASVWGKSNVSKSKPVFVVNGVNHMMTNVNGDGFLGTNWQRFKVSFVATDSDVIIGFSTTGSVDGNITNFAGGKLETGSLNTGWRPNDGDANVRVATAESTIIQQADQISQIVSKQTEVDGTVSQQRTEINQMADAIELQATQITDAEGRLSASEASLTLQADEIAMKVEQTDVDLSIGNIKLDSRNHVLNSNFLRGFDDWTNVSNDYSIIEIGLKKYARISRNGLYSNLISSMSTNKIFVKKNDKLLIGCDIIVDGVAGYDIQKPFMVEFFDINDVRVDYKEYNIADFGVTLASRVEERLTTNITIDRDDVAKMCVKLTLYRNGIVSYSNISVQKGDIGTGGWTPAPEDNQMIQASLKSEIIQTADLIALKADKSVVDGLSGDFTQMSADLIIANDSITANVGEMTRIDGVVTQHGLDITATARELSTKMTSLQVEDLLSGKDYATQSELKQTSDSIILSVGNVVDVVTGIDSRLKNAESAITEDAITNTVMGTTKFSAKLAEYAKCDELSNYATTEELSGVKNTADLTKKAIEDLDLTPYVTSTQIAQLEDSITNKVSQSGGVNMLKNSIGWNGVDFWNIVTGSPITTQTPQLDTFGFGSGWHKKHGTTATKITQTVSLPIAGTYTISFKMNKNTETIVAGKYSECGVYVDNLPFYGKGTGSGITSGFEDFSLTFTTTKLTADISIVIGELAEATISGVMLNLGSFPLQWTSHSTEIYNTNVRVDINGVQVMGNRNGKRTVINTEEFAGYENNEKVFTVNGDTTEVKKLKAEKQFAMAPITIITIDNANYSGWAFI